MSIQTRTTAIQNEVVRLYCKFINDGLLLNPASQPTVEILDTDGVTVLQTLTAQNENLGIYYVDWFVPAHLPLGNYYDKWLFQWSPGDSVEELSMIIEVHSLETYINFIARGISYKISNRAAQLMSDLANDFIYEAQHIPIYWEQGMRVLQENQKKRTKHYYYFTLTDQYVSAHEGDIYSVGANQYTVFQDIIDSSSSSSLTSSSSSSLSSFHLPTTSSSSSDSSTSSLESNSSSFSTDSSQSSFSSSSSFSSFSSTSSSTSSLDSSSSSSFSSLDSSSSSTNSIASETTVSSDYIREVVLTCVGYSNPPISGVLTKVSGEGSTTLTYSGFTRKTSNFSSVYNFAYKNWLMDPRPIVRLNNRITDDGWHADYEGKIYWDRAMTPEDSINCSYQFAYFSEEELLSFLQTGLQMMNSVPPASSNYQSLESCPRMWNYGIILYAAITALKRLIFGLNWQEKMIIFGSPDDAKNAQANFKELYAGYQEIWNEYAKNIKTKMLPGIAITIQPEMTLPGGRCMSSDTCINAKINNIDKNITIKELYKMYTNGDYIRVLSMLNGVPEFVDINKIWESGIKQTYILKTKSSEIRLTKEHLVFMPDINSYKTVMDITKKDNILVLNDGKLEIQKLLDDPIKYKEEEVFDIEVPLTENFIGNNIVSHNSRFFRYMFKSN